MLFVVSCEENVQNPDTTDIVFPKSNVSYTTSVEPLFQRSCSFIGCHGGTDPAMGLDLTTPSYSKLRDHQPTLVVGGEPNNSLLIQRLDGSIPPQMPLFRRPLTENQINGIKTWIAEGARLN